MSSFLWRLQEIVHFLILLTVGRPVSCQHLVKYKFANNNKSPPTEKTKKKR